MDGRYKSTEELLGRLKRIEGQVRGIQRMVTEETYCIDILTQITAASHALKRVAVGLLEDHIARCVDQGVATGGSGARDMVTEASAAIGRLVKS